MTKYNKQDFHNWFKSPVSMQFTDLGFPIMKPVYEVPEEFSIKPFTRFRRNEDLSSFLHFYQEDHKFDRVWNAPEKYLEGLRKYPGVFSPDFSLYSDTPLPLQMWNHYRKQWCGAYWQSQGLTVIPTIGWAGPDSYSFCFEGIPQNSVVSVSALGVINNKAAREAFLIGYNRMLEVLNPTLILFYSGAKFHKTLEGPIQYVGNTKIVGNTALKRVKE